MAVDCFLGWCAGLLRRSLARGGESALQRRVQPRPTEGPRDESFGGSEISWCVAVQAGVAPSCALYEGGW